MEEYGEVMEDIDEIKYKKRENILRTGFIGSAVLTMGLCTGGVITEEIYRLKNPYKTIKEQYDSVSQSIDILEGARDKFLTIPYQPEYVKPYLEDILNEKERKSLESAIGLLRKDAGDIKDSVEFKKYEEYNNGEEKVFKYYLGGSLIGLLSTFAFGLLSVFLSVRRK